MRYGVISDVHGNLRALHASLAVLARLGVDGWLSVGDLIGYGPYPNECVETVAELGALGVAGNHELVALGELPGDASSQRAHESHRWTARVLSPATRTYLGTLPVRRQVGEVLLTHGSLDDPEHYVRGPGPASRQLEQLTRESPDARVLLLGNTHQQLWYTQGRGPRPIGAGPALLDPDHRHLLNPGSVGQSRTWEWPPLARCLLLDLDQRRVSFCAVSYDLRACRRDLRRYGRPYRSIHAPPRIGPSVRRRWRAFAGRSRPAGM